MRVNETVLLLVLMGWFFGYAANNNIKNDVLNKGMLVDYDVAFNPYPNETKSD